jgi:hypothetical protein
VSAERQLDEFLSRYAAEVRDVAVAAVEKLRARVPGAMRLVYDNYNALVIAFSASEKTSDVVFSVTLYPRWVSLFFTYGAALPDPKALLRGSGTRVRSIVLESAADLDQPAVRALLAAALKAHPIDAAGEGRLVIKMIAKNQRARRPR